MEPGKEGMACRGRSLRLGGARTMPRGELAGSLGSAEMLLQRRPLPRQATDLRPAPPCLPSRGPDFPPRLGVGAPVYMAQFPHLQERGW